MNNDHDKLERLIHGVLRDIPAPRAPSSLESRVLAAIEAGPETTGWRRGFLHWPLVARVAFVLASFGVVRLALLGMDWMVNAVDPATVVGDATARFTWIKVLAEVLISSLRSIPEHWLWGVFAVVAAAYAVFFMISAIAYRTLYAGRRA